MNDMKNINNLNLNHMSRIYLIALCCLFFASCNNILSSGIKGNGNIISKEITISEFNKIVASGAVDIIYEQDTTKIPYLKVEVDDNILEYILIETKNNELTISTKKTINPTRFKVYTNSNNLENINLSGASDIELISDLKNESLKIQLSGSSDLKSKNRIEISNIEIKTSGASDLIIKQLIADKTTVSCTGSSDITIAGTTNYLTADANGSSDLKIDNFKAKNANINISGSSDASLYVTDSLNVKASGSSDVKYKGKPLTKSISSTGSSDIKEK